MNPSTIIQGSTMETQSLAQFNRDQLNPFITRVIESMYAEVDKATEKGIALSGLTEDEAKKCVAQILFNIQKNMNMEVYTDRNLFQSAAYAAGVTLGYPMGAVNAIISKLPLIGHFKAGMGDGEVLFQRHAFAVYSKVMSKKNDISKYLTKGKEVNSHPPVVHATQLSPA